MPFKSRSLPEAIRQHALDVAVEQSLADLREGRLSEAGEVFDQLEAKYRRMAAWRASQQES